MAYGSDAEDEGLGASDMDPGTAGGDTEQDDAVSDQYSAFESGFNAAAANTAGSSLKSTPLGIGSQKGSVTSKGGKYSSDFAEKAYDPTINTSAKSAKAQNDLARGIAATAQVNKAAAQQYATLPNEGFFESIFRDPKQAGKDTDEYGEFYQAAFSKNINNIENLNAARSNLPAGIAFDVAMNPFGRFSSTGEKLGAALQSAIPGGSIIGIGRALSMMGTPGPASGQGGTDEGTGTPNPTKSQPRKPRVTSGANNKPNLNIPTRAQLRRRGPRRV